MAEYNQFDIEGYVFPIVSGTPGKEQFIVDRFIGTGFWTDSKGHFLTCSHVLNDLKEGQCPAIAQPFGNKREYYIPVLKSEAHPTYDMAMGTVRLTQPSKFLQPYTGHIAPG